MNLKPQASGKKDELAQKDQVARLYEEYKRPMWRYANHILHDEQLADDVVQSAFQKIIEKIDLISSLNCNKLHSYIVIVVRNLSYTAYNQRKKRTHLPLDDLAESIPDLEDSPEDTLVRLCEYEDIKAAQKKLHTSYKDVLTMKFVYQYSDEEIAQLMGIKPASVRVVTCRALKALKKTYCDQLEREEAKYEPRF